MPEAVTIARQLDPEIRGKTVAGFTLRGCENFQRIGFFNKDSAAFERLVGLTIDSVVSRGNTIVVKLSGEQNLIVSPEYGGEVFFHENDRSLPRGTTSGSTSPMVRCSRCGSRPWAASTPPATPVLPSTIW